MKVYSVEDRYFKDESVLYSDCCTVYIASTYEKAMEWCLKNLEEYGKGRSKTRENGWCKWYFAIMEDEVDNEDGGVILASVFPEGSVTNYVDSFSGDSV